MSSDSTVRRRGTDTSGRAIWMSDRLAAWWDGYVDRLGFTPTIVQGAWMIKNGGGADASAGYHDRGGCLDLRTWDKTPAQQEAMVRVAREGGAGAWLRDKTAARGGMDPHLHLVLGTDHDLAEGARHQWGEYVAGRSGLASRGADYHPRPKPLVTTIPTDWGDDIMATLDEVREVIAAEIKRQVPTAQQVAEAVWTRDVLTGEPPAQPGGRAPTKRAGVMLRQIWRRTRKSGGAA